MKKQKNKSANKFDLEYFEDSTNFPNQIFLQDVFKYFENKNNQNTFELVEFLNLFKEQNDLLIENLSNPGKTFRNLKSLPVSGLDLHVLYFFILEFYGGYPLKEYQYYEYAESELNPANEEFARNYNTLLKLIETEFLSYPEDTAEKKTYLVKANDDTSLKLYKQAGKNADQDKAQINKFCKSMALSIPKDYFIIFTRSNSKINGKPFLTDKEYNSFIERAFLGNTNLPKQKFNMALKGEKLKIQAVFYDFYFKYCVDYFGTSQCQSNFVELLTDNFIGWDYKNVINNFKPKTKKRI